jgi:hypothetical protein
MFKARFESTCILAVDRGVPAKPQGFAIELRTYFGRFRLFTTRDWFVYLAWIGLISGLCVASSLFLAIGRAGGAPFPSEAYWIPIGAGIFALAIAVDTIGHRTVYKEILRGGEGLVHHIIIVCGTASCVLLCAAYPAPCALALPALILTILSFTYSFVDEAMHWRRYLTARSDVVEMWSHVFILIGHGLMMLGWWRWYYSGYRGVAETLAVLIRM